MTGDGPVAGPPPPGAARELFGDRIDLAERYVALLADTGIAHGLLGPRETARLWDRHVLNCAVIHPVFDRGATVVDIGSGAGLPGIVLAICRPDLRVHLVEPLARRTVWLQRTVEELSLENVSVHRGRAESLWGERRFRYATARAVARIGDLARMALPLLETGGSLHALKGGQATDELATDRAAVTAAGGVRAWIQEYGTGLVEPPTVLVSVAVDREVPPPSSGRPRRRR